MHVFVGTRASILSLTRTGGEWCHLGLQGQLKGMLGFRIVNQDNVTLSKSSEPLQHRSGQPKNVLCGCPSLLELYYELSITTTTTQPPSARNLRVRLALRINQCSPNVYSRCSIFPGLFQIKAYKFPNFTCNRTFNQNMKVHFQHSIASWTYCLLVSLVHLHIEQAQLDYTISPNAVVLDMRWNF